MVDRDNRRLALKIATILEQQLAALDEIGAHVPAAYVDAAIQHLRRSHIKR